MCDLHHALNHAHVAFPRRLHKELRRYTAERPAPFGGRVFTSLRVGSRRAVGRGKDRGRMALHSRSLAAGRLRFCQRQISPAARGSPVCTSSLVHPQSASLHAAAAMPEPAIEKRQASIFARVLVCQPVPMLRFRIGREREGGREGDRGRGGKRQRERQSVLCR